MKLKRSTKFWLWLTVIAIGAMIIFHEYIHRNVFIVILCSWGFLQILISITFTDYKYNKVDYLIDHLITEGDYNWFHAFLALTNPFVLISMLNKALNKYDDERNKTE